IHPFRAELYDSASGTWKPTGRLVRRRSGHTATLLNTGMVLVAANLQLPFARRAELYDPASGTWRPTGSFVADHFNGCTATLLSGGNVLLAGGNSIIGLTELYDPATGSWTATGSLIVARSYHTATLLPDGKVLVAGGLFGAALSSAELGV